MMRACRYPSYLFQSTLSVRRATCANSNMRACMSFQSTLSVRRATKTDVIASAFALFQSTLSVRRATRVESVASVAEQFQSTLSVRRATHRRRTKRSGVQISIHALREESDLALMRRSRSCCRFQSTLSVRRATMAALVLARRSLFQSTLSVRRATKERVALAVRKPFQSTLSVRRATLAPEKAGGKHVISIHALREESDSFCDSRGMNPTEFQSTLSVRRATVQLDIFVRFLRRKPAA